MPPLLTPAALDAPDSRPRWTVIGLAVLLLLTWGAGAQGTRETLWDNAKKLLPAATEHYEWTRADIEAAPAAYLDGNLNDPDDAHTAQLTAGGLIIDLAWDRTVTPTLVRVETYTDARGTGHRLAIAAETTTATGTGCAEARLTTHDAQTSVQTCTRTDQHPAPERHNPGWKPDHLYITQTANLDPANYLDPTLIDHFSIGHNTGNAYESSLWGPNLTAPPHDPQADCDSAPPHLLLDDTHLHDPEPTGTLPQPTDQPGPAHPELGKLLTTACTPIESTPHGNRHTAGTQPWTQSTPTPLTTWARYNAATDTPQPITTAIALDIRTCDTAPPKCATDATTNWIDELLTA